MRQALRVLLLVAISSVATAEVWPAPGGRDSRVRIAHYDPEQVYRLQAHVGYQIELELEAGETVLGQGAGDLEGLALESFGNHVFIKPKASDVATNLMIATNKRSYRFHYAVSGRAPDPLVDEVMYVVRFRYPPAPVVHETASKIAEKLEERLAAVHRPHNVDYWYRGEAALRPIAAWDDGVHTRLRFAAQAELPAVFVRNDDGSESLLNFSMEEGDLVIHRVGREFVVRRGRLVGCIENTAFTGAGERLESGTIARDVVRETREVSP